MSDATRSDATSMTHGRLRGVYLTLFAVLCLLGLHNAAVKVVLPVAVLIILLQALARRCSSGWLTKWCHLGTGGLLVISVFAALWQRDLGWSFGVSGAVLIACGVIWFRHAWRGWSMLAMSMALCLFVLAGYEMLLPPGMHFVGKTTPVLKYNPQVSFGKFYKLDDTFGWRPIPNVEQLIYGMAGKNKVEWRAEYHTDADGWRVVPGRPDSGPRVLLIGGSFAFGHALNDDETIAARMQAKLPNMRVHNHGINGHSTAQALMLLRDCAFDDVTWVIYVFIAPHTFRNMGDIHWIRKGRYRRTPLMRADASGNMAIVDPPAIRPVVLKLDAFLTDRSAIYDKVKFLPPFSATPRRAYEVTGDLILAMHETATDKWGGDCGFAVMSVPSADDVNLSPEAHDMTNRCEANGIRYLNGFDRIENQLKSHADLKRADMHDKASGHPTAMLASWIADWCVGMLEE